jgi:hypothetical protein
VSPYRCALPAEDDSAEIAAFAEQVRDGFPAETLAEGGLVVGLMLAVNVLVLALLLHRPEGLLAWGEGVLYLASYAAMGSRRYAKVMLFVARAILRAAATPLDLVRRISK